MMCLEVLFNREKEVVILIEYTVEIVLSIPFDAHIPDSRGRRPYKYNTLFRAEFGELHILGKKSVPRMNSLSPSFEGSFQNLILSKITLTRCSRSQSYSRICLYR